ncbi:Ca(2+)-dependent cysteine protease [Tulasnella sp. 330]|nr:Ca(2+)-dependent cysteine protease [Tulasnella sp. 330]
MSYNQYNGPGFPTPDGAPNYGPPSGFPSPFPSANPYGSSGGGYTTPPYPPYGAPPGPPPVRTDSYPGTGMPTPPRPGRYPDRPFSDSSMGQGGFNPPQGSPYAPPPGPPPLRNRGSGYPGENWGPNNGAAWSPPPGPPPNMGPQSFQYQPPSGPPVMPPSQTQYFGPPMGGSQGGDQFQPNFTYSQCNGRKKALLIGINYVGTSNALSGCQNDAKNMKQFIQRHYNYQNDDVVMLTDERSRKPQEQPTRANIIRDSGHGGLTKDLDGDEDDGYDEVIYPVDFESKDGGQIVDDEMHDIMVKPLPAGCRLTAIFDSCHSGSALDLPYIYSTEGKIKEPNLLAAAGTNLMGVVKGYAARDFGSMLKGASGLFNVASGKQGKAEEFSYVKPVIAYYANTTSHGLS